MVNVGVKSAAQNGVSPTRRKIGDRRLDKQKENKDKPGKRPRYDLETLLDQITPDNQPESFDDPPVGEDML